MGARLSAKSTPDVPPLPPLTAVPPPTATPTQKEEASLLNNPGDYEDIGKKVKEHMFPTCIEGAKVVIQKGLSSHLQTMHTLTLGSSKQPSQWQYGATYVGTTPIGENDFRPVMIGDMSSSGNFTALFIHQFKNIKMKLNAQTQKSMWVGYQGTSDYMGSDFTASITAANPDVISGSGVMVVQYLQSLTNNLALGSELVYQRSGGMQGAMLSLGGYYRAKMWEASARLGFHSWNVNYHQKLDKNFVLMASLDGSLMQNESIASIGYKMDVGGLTMRGKVSTHGEVCAAVEKRLEPLPATLMLTGQLNHWTDDSKIGIAVVVG